jgi:hypothetical protein
MQIAQNDMDCFDLILSKIGISVISEIFSGLPMAS